MSFDDIEAELAGHPAVRECVVTRIPAGSRKETLVAYVVTTGRVDTEEIRAFLSAPRLRPGRVPRAVIPVDALPRTPSGEVDRAALPLPVLPGRAAGGKGTSHGLAGDRPGTGLAAMVGMALPVAAVAFVLTDALWSGSTELAGVPQPWAALFLGLYVAECLAFGLGVAFLAVGHPRLDGRGRPEWLTRLAHLALVWLLAAWWPQDNFYRLASRTDWERQAALVYGFNITLMIAAVIVIGYAIHDRRDA